MDLKSYTNLIIHLPVKEQSFKTKRSTWIRAETQFDWLRILNDRLFEKEEFLTINRQDIFNSLSPKEAIIKTVYWDNPNGKRGNYFIGILKNFELIEKTFTDFQKIEHPIRKDFYELSSVMESIPGLGISTYSKFLYYLNLKIDNNECLIFDKRILNILMENKYIELQDLEGINTYNKVQKYPDYIRVLNQISKTFNTNPENVEQFLFSFYNLKPIK